MADEIWKAVPGYEGAYEVSDHGRVRSLDRVVRQRSRGGNLFNRIMPGRILTLEKDVQGYWRVTLWDQDDGTHFKVHYLMLLAFVGPRPNDMIVLHRDGNKDRNVLDNLRYGTPKENTADAIDHGTFRHSERHGSAKLTTEQVLRIRALRGVATQVDLAAEFGVSQPIISSIQLRRHWKHV